MSQRFPQVFPLPFEYCFVLGWGKVKSQGQDGERKELGSCGPRAPVTAVAGTFSVHPGK